MNPDDAEDDDDFGTSIAVLWGRRFTRMIREVPWFTALGEPLGPAARGAAESYGEALGLGEISVAVAPDWDTASEIFALLEAGENTATENEMEAALLADAAENVDEEELVDLLQAVRLLAARVVHAAAAQAAMRSGVRDPDLVRAAAEAAVSACTQAALVIAAGMEETHPFAHKYRLFEIGRWPLGLIGQTLHLF